MATRVTIDSRLDVTLETDPSDAPFIDTDVDTVLLTGLSSNDQLTDGDLPAVGHVVAWDHTLDGSSDDLDLTAAPRANNIGDTVDLTGQKLLALKAVAPATNTTAITITDGDSNGYPVGELVIFPGEDLLLNKRSGGATGRVAVAADKKILKIAGTNTEKVRILAVFGDA